MAVQALQCGVFVGGGRCANSDLQNGAAGGLGTSCAAGGNQVQTDGWGADSRGQTPGSQHAPFRGERAMGTVTPAPSCPCLTHLPQLVVAAGGRGLLQGTVPLLLQRLLAVLVGRQVEVVHVVVVVQELLQHLAGLQVRRGGVGGGAGGGQLHTAGSQASTGMQADVWVCSVQRSRAT